ncbi:MAG: hypothetical protein JSS49_15580 [Planctomycetes bacterium]|nr:hypothetical protein [Planctomycetota bacterium]
MLHIPERVSVMLVLLSLTIGCSSDAGPVRATWEYTELAKDDNGHVKEIGDMHTFRSGGDEMYQIQGKTLEVVTVTSATAKFRLSSGDSADKKEAAIQPGNSQDLWLATFGVRVRVAKIGPI